MLEDVYRSKMPVGEMQPVQVCSSRSQVAKVLLDGGVPSAAKALDDDLAALDRLADML